MDFFPIDMNTASAGIFVLIFLFYYYYLSRKYFFTDQHARKRVPAPEAGGAWPVIGHLHLLGGPQLPHITLAAMADKYGPGFTIRLGVHRFLVVSGWELAKEIFTTYDLFVTNRPHSMAAEHLGHNYASFGFSPYGSYWRELRKLTSLELLSARRLELLRHVRASETESSLKELYKLWLLKKNDSGRALVEMKQWFGDLTLNVILRMVAGKRFFGANAVADEKEARRCQKVMRNFFHYFGLFAVSDALPFLRRFDIDGLEKAMKETGQEMDGIVGDWLKEHQEKRASAGEPIVDQDFMDVMLSTLEGADFAASGFDADTITKATCLALITGGNDTTSVMLIWVLSLLLNNRHALRKVQEELEVHVGKERRVNETDIHNLIYLQAVVKETLRLYPAGPLGGIREFSEDCTVGGYFVPKGTRLMINMWKLHRDPNVWPDPSEFRPERFLTTHKDVDVKGQHFELIPFGAGRRICPGSAFGLQMIHVVIANLLHAFEFCTPDDVLVDMTESPGLTNLKATPLDVLISPRLSPNLY